MPPFAPARAWFLALVLSAAACNDPPPPVPTKVAERSNPGVPAKPPRSEDPSPFRNPDTDPPPPRSEPQLAPEELAALFAAVDDALKVGDVTTAQNHLRRCANKVPQSVRCEGELAVLLGKLKRFKAEAGYYLEQAIGADDPALDDAYYRRFGAALMARGLAREAAVAYERMVARTNATAADWYLLGEALQGVPERLADASDAMRRAYELDPTQDDWLRTEAILLGQQPDKIAQALARLELYRTKIKDPELLADTDRRLEELRRLEQRPPADTKSPAAKTVAKPRKQKPASG